LDVGGCYVNNKRMHIASRQVRGGDKVRVEFSLEGLSKAQRKTFVLTDSEILYDAHHVIAINKPPGLPSQATRDQDVMHAEVCLREWLKSKNRTSEKLILVHRLDKETSGVLLFATNANTATWITEQFRQRSLSKTYWALVRGFCRQHRFEVDCYLSEIDKKTGMVSAVKSGGKPSKTSFEVRSANKDAGVTWIVCHPETGRSHQIRVHLEMSGLPILGDKRYGQSIANTLGDDVMAKASSHHMLHARELQFSPAPGLDDVKLTAEPPANFVDLLSQLKLSQ